MRKYRQLLESVESGEEMEEDLKDYKDDYSDLDEDRYEEELPGDEDMGMDSSIDMDDYDLDSELDMEIARDGLEDEYMGDDEEYVAPDLDSGYDDMGGDLEPENDDVIFNYTATIQLTGYDFPLVLQADDMEEIKTVMRVMQQSGLNPKGDYKWNSKTFEIDLDESVEENKLVKEGKSKRKAVYYQPSEDVLPDDMASFEVYRSLKRGMEDYPDIPRDKWDRYSGDDIEDPTYLLLA